MVVPPHTGFNAIQVISFSFKPVKFRRHWNLVVVIVIPGRAVEDVIDIGQVFNELICLRVKLFVGAGLRMRTPCPNLSTSSANAYGGW
jgi:hypothetical protein